MEIRQALTFDDVMLVPAASAIMPGETDTRARLTREIELGIPLVSAAMDTVTESALAIAMAQAGGIGVIHRNMGVDQQADEVRKVKKFEAGMVVNPVTIHPDETLADALRLMADHKISGIPVVERGSGRLAGILTNRDVRFADDPRQPVAELMTRDRLVTVRENVAREDAKRLLHQHRIEKLLVVDEAYRCVGLITVKDIEKAQRYPTACKDEHGRLRVAAATGPGSEGIERAEALFAAGLDVLVVDTAHGHSDRVLRTLREVRRLSNYTQVIAGNVATAEGARALVEAGADAIKVGIGPGSICTTRMVAGVGVPQFTAIADTVAECRKTGVPVISDGGHQVFRRPRKGDRRRGRLRDARLVVRRHRREPGRGVPLSGPQLQILPRHGLDRGDGARLGRPLFPAGGDSTLKLVPEGVEGRVPHKGPVGNIVHQLIGGLRAAMGYTGNRTIREMQKNCTFVRITGAGLRESHVHDVAVTREAPNYPQDR